MRAASGFPGLHTSAPDCIRPAGTTLTGLKPSSEALWGGGSKSCAVWLGVDTAWLPPEDVEGFDFQDLPNAYIAGDPGDHDDHAEGQAQVPEGDHRGVVGHPGPGNGNHQRDQPDTQTIARQGREGRPEQD